MILANDLPEFQTGPAIFGYFFNYGLLGLFTGFVLLVVFGLAWRQNPTTVLLTKIGAWVTALSLAAFITAVVEAKTGVSNFDLLYTKVEKDYGVKVEEATYEEELRAAEIFGEQPRRNFVPNFVTIVGDNVNPDVAAQDPDRLTCWVEVKDDENYKVWCPPERNYVELQELSQQ